MNALVGMALWFVVGNLIAAAVLTEHLRTGGRFPRKAGWWLIPLLIIGWPWPVWVWWADTRTARPPRGLAALVVIGALGLGWGGGLKLYDFLYPKELEPPDILALNAMIERLITNSDTKNEQPQILFTFR